MHLPPLKAFGWNDKRNPWTGPPIQMEMSPPRCVWCAQQWSMGIRGDYEGCLPYHPVFTRREALILYAVDWRAWKLTEQTDNSALHSWASIYPEKSDKEALKNNNRFRHTDTLLCLFIKRGIFPSTKLFNLALIDLGINSKVCVLYCLSLGIKWEQYNIYHWKKIKQNYYYVNQKCLVIFQNLVCISDRAENLQKQCHGSSVLIVSVGYPSVLGLLFLMLMQL